MGVPPGRYKTFGELNKHVIKPAVEEVNALAPFGISILPIKQGKRVVQIKVGWWTKDNAQLGQAYDELQRSKIGRRARISGNVEYVPTRFPPRLGWPEIPRSSAIELALPRIPHSWRPENLIVRTRKEGAPPYPQPPKLIAPNSSFYAPNSS